MVTYRLDKNGEFVISDYNLAKPWSSFFPGIAGLWGIPLWVFYVNRGQGIVSAGIRSKDEPIMEFWPANKAYHVAPSLGFRTFIKVLKNKDTLFYEPFSSTGVLRDASLSNEMRVAAGELALSETNASLGLRCDVRYFTVPGEPFAALAREAEFTNISKKTVSLEICDGLAAVAPYGINNWFLKEMGRTIEAWMTVEEAHPGVAVYKLSTDPRDTAQVSFVKGAHFYLSVLEDKTVSDSKLIVDPRVLFGRVTDLSVPANFAGKGPFRFPKSQIARNLTPSAMTFFKLILKPGEKRSLNSLIGHVFDVSDIGRCRIPGIRRDYFVKKRKENLDLIDGLMGRAQTASSSALFDHYARQTYLDNVLRGGMPETFTVDGKPKNVYVFSRKHGDLERDYNRFQVTPTYFSEGEGNYRDVNQNRRMDVFFEPRLGLDNIRAFLNLIQLDGYNPLVFKGMAYRIPSEQFLSSPLAKKFGDKEAHKLAHFVSRPFKFGDAMSFIDEHRIAFEGTRQELVEGLLGMASASVDAVFGEGYWTDHWTYNTDLLQSYAAVYPDRFLGALLEDADFTYFDSEVFVRPRSERTTFVHGEARQYHSIFHDKEKAALIQKRGEDKHVVRRGHGEGDVLKTTLAAKLVCLIVNKLATLDPSGVGIEMEADKPNWYDSLNGLPGLFGSSVSETFELKRLVIFLRDWLGRIRRPEDFSVETPAEVAEFLRALDALLDGELNDFDYWDKANAVKEAYRLSVRKGVSGAMVALSLVDISLFLGKAQKKLDAATEKSFDKKTGSLTTYFVYAMTRYETIGEKSGKGPVVAKEFKQIRLPLFLEGYVHAMRTERSRALEIHRSLRKSALWDRKLGMYKVNASLGNESYEIGRTRAFTPGWLENESVWLHMEYKYLLELLKNGLAEEFYDDFFHLLVCFQKPAVYGRSILENSSFIVSSAHPDPSLHGTGFVARLSGSTAEFIHMWLLMNLGPEPFFVDARGKLAFRLEPILDKRLFTKKRDTRPFIDKRGESRIIETPAGGYSFLLMGRTIVTYVNPKKKDTFGPAGARVGRVLVYDGKALAGEGANGVVAGALAERIRDGGATKIVAELE